MTRTLALLRHAKSDWPWGVADHDRPLAPRGRRDAPVAGMVLAEEFEEIDLVLVSSAARAAQTWEMASGGVRVREVRTEPRVYEATPSDLLQVIAAVPAEVGSLLIVGHNPGMEELAGELVGGGDRLGLDAMRFKYPTCGLAILEAADPWSGLRRGGADLRRFAIPRG